MALARTLNTNCSPYPSCCTNAKRNHCSPHNSECTTHSRPTSSPGRAGFGVLARLGRYFHHRPKFLGRAATQVVELFCS